MRRLRRQVPRLGNVEARRAAVGIRTLAKIADNGEERCEMRFATVKTRRICLPRKKQGSRGSERGCAKEAEAEEAKAEAEEAKAEAEGAEAEADGEIVSKIK